MLNYVWKLCFWNDRDFVYEFMAGCIVSHLGRFPYKCKVIIDRLLFYKRYIETSSDKLRCDGKPHESQPSYYAESAIHD